MTKILNLSLHRDEKNSETERGRVFGALFQDAGGVKFDWVAFYIVECNLQTVDFNACLV